MNKEAESTRSTIYSSTTTPRRDVNAQNENSECGKSSSFKLPGRNESEEHELEARTDLIENPECTTISSSNWNTGESNSNRERSQQNHVHVECLNRWRLRSQKKTSFFQCDECKYQYAFRRTTIAKYATNEFVLKIVTLLLFACCVFLGGFFAKFFLYFNGFKAMTFAKIFTVDYNHLISGFVFVGVIGFLQILFSLLWLGPFPSLNIRLPSGGGRGGGRGDNFAILVVAVILAMGVVKAIWGMYKFAQTVSRLILERVELVILEVNAPVETPST
ncbi:6814_t:CDS:2 [Ambispora leptoticha]|uniref:6814_t:CDS:1 n=1 Tax=Ambispora leptoticha TaxID=144679 RepID=A0A9N8Z9V3_9GLOM|nr:6814_t:CDS:2 [Ambispora leptoticha]